MPSSWDGRPTLCPEDAATNGARGSGPQLHYEACPSAFGSFRTTSLAREHDRAIVQPCSDAIKGKHMINLRLITPSWPVTRTRACKVSLQVTDNFSFPHELVAEHKRQWGRMLYEELIHCIFTAWSQMINEVLNFYQKMQTITYFLFQGIIIMETQ